jgi:hypothetical protein
MVSFAFPEHDALPPTESTEVGPRTMVGETEKRETHDPAGKRTLDAQPITSHLGYLTRALDD